MSATAEPFMDRSATTLQRTARARADSREASGLTLTHLAKADWDAAVAHFDGIAQEMTHVFASARWPAVGLEPVLFEKDGEPVAGALVMIQKLPLNLSSLAVIKWGVALKEESEANFHAIYPDALELLIAEYAQKRRMMISLMQRAPEAEDAWVFDYLMERGFKSGSQLLFPNRYLVDLRLDDDAQRKSFAQKWRYHLKKSEKEGLSFERATPDRLGDFDTLYEAMTDRKKFPDYSAYHTLPHLMATEVEALRPELFFVRHEGEAVAGAVIFKAGKTATYLYGATNHKALGLRAGYFMHWHIIRWLRENTRADWYDLGGTDGFQGLHQFKKGMVGSAGLITAVPPVANYASYTLPLVVGTSAFVLRDGAQHAMRLLNQIRVGMAHPNQGR